jgi:sugar lactone lactonase YvrE
MLFATSAEASVPVGTISPVTGNLAATDCINPEGITLDFQGNIYTGSAKLAPVTHICKFDHNGAFVKSVPISAGPGGLAPLLGVHFEAPHTIIALDFANTLLNRTANQGRVLSVNMETGAVTTIASGFSFPNGIAEDLQGNLYIADSFQGTITRMRQDGSNKTVWSADPLLAGNTTIPGLPIGANGIAFDLFFRHLYVSNTSNRRVVRIDVGPNWTAGAAEIFADGATIDANQQTTKSLLGVDGITFDLFGNLYVAANAANEIQVLSPSAQLTARYSSPTLPMDTTASPIFWGGQLFFTNLSLLDGGINSSVGVLQTPTLGLPPL